MKLYIVTSLIILISLVNCKLNKRLDCRCTLGADKKIINGRISHATYPFLATISYNKYRLINKNLKRFLPSSIKLSGLTCSAVLLNENWLLSSAVCLSSNLDHLSVGLNSQNDLISIFDQDPLKIKRIIIHPKFNSTANKDFGHNLALIELENQVNFTSNDVHPACLKIESTNSVQNLIAAGWGGTVNELSADNFKSRFLKEIDLVNVSNETSECIENTNLMCTKSRNNKDIINFNDLGGSVMEIVNGRVYLISILSHLNIEIDHEKEKAHITDLSFSTKLADSISWIESYIHQDYCAVRTYEARH